MSIRFKNIIVVGLGQHAKNKIIPAITSLKLNIICIISSQNIKYSNIPIYKNLNDITKIKFNKKNTVIFLCTPPKTHYKQIRYLTQNNLNIFVEKPAFIRKKNIEVISKINKNIVVENLMYQHTKIYKHLTKFWSNKVNKIHQIDINFIIPSIPNDTFRNNNNIYNSYIFDIGSYPITLLNKLKMDFLNCKYNFKLEKNKFKNLSKISINFNKIKSKICIGIDHEYQNNVIIHYDINKKIKFDYFFYGPKKTKNITYYKNHKLIKVNKLNDFDGFVEILKVKKNSWKKNQSNRLHDMHRVLYFLNKIAKKYINSINA